MRYQTTRVYAGGCPHCGHEMRRAIDDTQGQSGKPGVLLRCAECRDVSFALPESTGEVRDGPGWFVEGERVDEWFEYGEEGER